MMENSRRLALHWESDGWLFEHVLSCFFVALSMCLSRRLALHWERDGWLLEHLIHLAVSNYNYERILTPCYFHDFGREGRHHCYSERPGVSICSNDHFLIHLMFDDRLAPFIRGSIWCLMIASLPLWEDRFDVWRCDDRLDPLMRGSIIIFEVKISKHGVTRNQFFDSIASVGRSRILRNIRFYAPAKFFMYCFHVYRVSAGILVQYYEN